MSDRGQSAYCEEAGHEKGTNQKKMNIYEVSLGKRCQKRWWKVRQVDVGEVVGIVGVGGNERWVGRGGE